MKDSQHSTINDKLIFKHNEHKVLMRNKIALWKTHGKIIVFTNGCFDLLHVGHISLFESAKEYGDKLIIGLNSDKSLERIKGNSRPIISQYNRAKVLSSIKFVDAICLFEEDTPEILIKIIKPDYLVKGADYEENEIVGASFIKSYGGKVIRIPLIENHSSSSIINKIRNS